MELYQLRSLAAIVNAGNFSRAAESLHISQPALTHQIKSLEEELGHALFERGARQVRLTSQGKLFYGYAQRIINLAEEGRHALAQYDEGAGRLTLGAGTTTILCRLPEWLQQYRANMPRVELSVRAGSSMEVIEAVLQDRVDFGLVTSPVPDRRILAFPLYQDEILLLAAPGLTPAAELAWTDLKRAPFLLFPKGSGFRKYVDDLFRRLGFEPRVALEIDSIEGIRQLAAIGMGLSFLPRIAVEAELKASALVALQPEPVMNLFRTTSLVYRKDKLWTPVMTAFAQQIAAAYPEAGVQIPAQHSSLSGPR